MAEQSSDCCEAAVSNPAAKRCCDSAASSESTLLGAKGSDIRMAATPPTALATGHEIAAMVGHGRDGRSSPAVRSREPLYTLHSVLLI